MPEIIAAAVIRMARTRLRAPSSAAFNGSAPPFRLNSAKVTSRIAFATATPMAMIAPMNDCTFNVVPVTSSISRTPHKTAGTVATTVSARRTDWKLKARS